MRKLGKVSVVVVTRNRREELARTLGHLRDTGEPSEVIVVDNASTDGTSVMVADEFPEATVVTLPYNQGSVARNLGVALAGTDLVAFADDDSWWEDGALESARALFGRSPRLGLVAGRVLVGSEGRVDPIVADLERSRLGVDRFGYGRILGFLAFAAVVRREAFLSVGGFEELLFFYGEEETLALDMAAAGWDLIYAPELVAWHYPDPTTRLPESRLRQQVRNRLLTSVIHRPWPETVRRMAIELEAGDRHRWAGLGRALAASPRALLRRRPVPPWLERQLTALDTY